MSAGSGRVRTAIAVLGTGLVLQGCGLSRPPSLAPSTTRVGDGIVAARFFPDGRDLLVAYHRGREQRLYRVAVDTGDYRPLTPPRAMAFDPDIAPDGSTVVFSLRTGGPATLYTVSSDGADLRELTPGDVWDFGARFSPDGTRIVYSTAPDGRVATLRLLDLGDGRIRELIGSGARRARHHTNAAFTPDGRAVLFWDSTYPTLRGWRLWTARFLALDGSLFVPVSDNFFDNAGVWTSFAPDGTAAFRIEEPHGDRAWTLSLEDPATLAPLRPRTEGYVVEGKYRGNTVRLDFPTFSPDGSSVVFTREDAGGLAELHTMDRRTGEARPLTALSRRITAPRFSPDGRDIVFLTAPAGSDSSAATEIRILDLDRGTSRVVPFRPD